MSSFRRLSWVLFRMFIRLWISLLQQVFIFISKMLWLHSLFPLLFGKFIIYPHKCGPLPNINTSFLVFVYIFFCLMYFLWFQTTPTFVAHCRQSTYHCCRFVCFRRNDNWNLHNITKMGLCYWFLLSDGHFLWFVVRVTFHMNLLSSLFHIGISFLSASCRLQAQRLVIVCHFCGVFILSKARERESVCGEWTPTGSIWNE